MTTKRQREIIKAVWEWIEDTGEVPSQRQLIDHLARMFHEADPEVADPAFSPF